jgi:dihydrofolate reductase
MIAIVAMASNRVIGRDGRIPWHLPDDLRFFKRTTLGHIVLMGRRTYDSIGRPLPGRENWVVTRQGEIPGVRTFHELAEIPPASDDGRQIYLIGGAQLYAALLPRCAEIFLTILPYAVEGDTFFPSFEGDFLAPAIVQTHADFQILHYHRPRKTEVGSLNLPPTAHTRRFPRC